MIKCIGFLIIFLFLISSFCFADIIIPEKYVQPLYEWYQNEFTIRKAYTYYRLLIAGYTFEINGIKISSKNTGDININLEDLSPIEIWDDGRYIFVGCVPIEGELLNNMETYFKCYLSMRINELLRTGETIIIPHNKHKGSLKIKILK
jgi:hypothetical protein